MSLQTVVPVTICPPAPQTEFFDQCQFDNKRVRAVTRDSGISFSDYNNEMHVISRRVFAHRTKFIPPFANNNKQLAHVLIVYGWRYLHGQRPVPDDLTLAELTTQISKRFGLRYRGSTKQQDRHRFVYENGRYMRVHASLAFRSWRIGETSPQIAAALHMTPQQVRITLYRLIKIGRQLGYETFDSSVMSATARRTLRRKKWRAEAILYRKRKKARLAKLNNSQ